RVSAHFTSSDPTQLHVGTVVVTDAGAPLTPGEGCTPIDAHTARCDTYEGVPLGVGTFDLGDRGDRLDASQLDAPVSARGGSGDDRILGGVFTDDLDGGTGHDLLDGGG